MIQPYYQDDACTIYHGDCREILPQLEPVDLVLTDPPYGIGMSEGFEGFEGFGGFGPPIARRQYPDQWDTARPGESTFQQILAKCENAIIFGGNYFADVLPRSSHWLVWDKLQTMPTFSDCELAWTNVDRKSVKKKVVQWNGLLGKERERFHPTQKPVELMAWCIENYSRPGQVVLDPFAGSGTTALAAKTLGRKCIAIEAIEKYCEIAVKRLAQEVLPL
jgi:site-specific DNA-methyltransferase (adenine-specific)/modification methylase